MRIDINGKTIVSVDFSDYETAWRAEDAFLVLEYLRERNEIVLGGDILNVNFKYAYANWYYENEPGNSLESIEVATEYLRRFKKMNGNSFYVVFVVRGSLFKRSPLRNKFRSFY